MMFNYKIDKYLAEETGIHMGDGSMNIYQKRSVYTIASHHIDDKEYIDEFVLPLMKRIYCKTPKPRLWAKGAYGFRMCSKEIMAFKHNVLSLPYGKKRNLKVPECILNDKDLMIAFVRGLVDTDGSLTLNNKYDKIYPRISFSNVNIELTEQVIKFLKDEGFRVSSWNRQTPNELPVKAFIINGYEMLFKWSTEIGFSNPKNLKKLELLKIYKNFYK